MSKTAAEARAERLAQALRANLKLRKAREREAVTEVGTADEVTPSPPAPSRSLP